MSPVAPLYLLAALIVLSTVVFARVLSRHPTLARIIAIADDDQSVTARVNVRVPSDAQARTAPQLIVPADD